MNLDLLERAAQALVDQVSDDRINMEEYTSDEVSIVDFNSDGSGNYCGTTACFAGWCPFLGIPELTPNKSDFLSHTNVLSYNRYIERVFGINSCSIEFDFFFGPEWPNSARSVLERVQLVKKRGGTIPPEEDWYELGWCNYVLSDEEE